jgi:hypothetical protein
VAPAPLTPNQELPVPTLQPRPKVSRSLRLLDIDGRLVLVITMQHSTRRAEEKFYHLTPLPTDSGCAFELRQSELCGSETYHVSLDDFGSCDCRGFTAWSHCKHFDAVKKLRELGRI